MVLVQIFVDNQPIPGL